MSATLLVDLGNVLVDFDPQATIRALRRATGLDEEVIRRAMYGDAWVELNEGSIDWLAFEALVGQELGGGLASGELREAWTSALTPREETVALLGQLVGRHPLYLLSNTDPVHFGFSRRLVPLLDRFSGFILSYVVHRMKPDPAFFHQALSFIGAMAPECVFIDDSAENVRSAAALGLPSIRYEGASHLRRALPAFGVQIPQPGARRAGS